MIVRSTEIATLGLRGHARAATKSYRIVDKQPYRHLSRKGGKLTMYIQIAACEGSNCVVVRYIPLDPEFAEYFRLDKRQKHPIATPIALL